MSIIIIDPEEFWKRMEKTLSNSTPPSKNEKSVWLRSKDVRKLLGISDALLQTLRINGAIPSYKLSNSWYYKEEEVIAALESGRTRKMEVKHG